MNTAIRRAVLELLADVPGALVESPGGHLMLAEWLATPMAPEFAMLGSGEQAMVRASMALHSGSLYDLFTYADREHVERFVAALVEVLRLTGEGDDFLRSVRGTEL